MLEKLRLFLQNPQTQFELKVAVIGIAIMTLYAIGTGNVHSVQDVIAGAHRR